MTFDEKVQAVTKTFTAAEIVHVVQRSSYRNATDTADVENIYRELGIDFTSTHSHHVPVAEANYEHPVVKVRRLIEDVQSLEDKSGTYWSSAQNKAVYDAVKALETLRVVLEGDQL